MSAANSKKIDGIIVLSSTVFEAFLLESFNVSVPLPSTFVKPAAIPILFSTALTFANARRKEILKTIIFFILFNFWLILINLILRKLYHRYHLIGT